MAIPEVTHRRKPSVGVQVETADPFVLRLPKAVTLRVSPAMFERICAENADLRLERTSTGGLIVMAPAGAESSNWNADLVTDLNNWARLDGTGKVFDATAGFTLSNGAVVGPDASWVALHRWRLLSADQRQRFPPICPDFVIELRSPSDRLPGLKRKMQRYIAQGVRLGWLIDPMTNKAEIYRPGRDPEVLDRPATLSGEDVLPGFVLDLRGILGD